ncbi:AaceriAFR737Wp [[Ashbya] aceris (nom. inval.)]|nr:AaceriAFR737Wp [[Ashbya] aceris (nom. inval.)]
MQRASDYVEAITARFTELEQQIKPIVSKYYLFAGETGWVGEIAESVAGFLAAVRFPLEPATIGFLERLVEYILVFPELTEGWLRASDGQTVPLAEFCRRGFASHEARFETANMRRMIPELEVLNKCLDALVVVGNVSDATGQWLPNLFVELVGMIRTEYCASVDTMVSGSINLFTIRCKTLCDVANLVSRENTLVCLKDAILEHCLADILVRHRCLDGEERKQMSYSLLVRFFSAAVSSEFRWPYSKTLENQAAPVNPPKKRLATILFADDALVRSLVEIVREDLGSKDDTTRLQALYFLGSMVQLKHESITASLFLAYSKKPEDIDLDNIAQWKRVFFQSEATPKVPNMPLEMSQSLQWYDWNLADDSILSELFDILATSTDEETVFQAYSVLLDISRQVHGRISDLWVPNGKMISLMEMLLTAGKNDKICTDFVTEMYCIIRSCAVMEYITYKCL